MALRDWKTVNVDLEVIGLIKKNRKEGEAINDTIRRLLGLPARQALRPVSAYWQRQEETPNPAPDHNPNIFGE